jgi:hypothetical protein
MMVTSQKIANYYDRYKTIDVTFTREILKVTGIITQQVYLKCGGDFWPCVVFSISFEKAKVVATIKSGILNKLQEAHGVGSLRLAFKSADSTAPVAFFINIKVAGTSPYGTNGDMALFTLQFTQRAPDDLVAIMGRVLDANVSFHQRREERINLTVDVLRKLNVMATESAVFIEGVPRRCILRDLSFSGAKVVMMGVAKYLVNKDISLRVDFQDPRESFLMAGKFVRSENVEGRKDLIALGIRYTENLIPMGYKIRINDYLSSQIRSDLNELNNAANKPQPAAASPAPASNEDTAQVSPAPAPDKPETQSVPLPPPPPMPAPVSSASSPASPPADNLPPPDMPDLEGIPDLDLGAMP